jgi:hypothetical protein
LGAALGIEYLFDLHRQIVVEVATLQIIGETTKPGARQKATSTGSASDISFL